MHPASHNCPIDNIGWVANLGIECVMHAVSGNLGNGIIPSCVDVILGPSGNRM